MSRRRSGFTLLVALGVIGGGAARGDAETILVRDELVADLDPQLGQGYSVSTNELLGTCFTKVAAAKPVYSVESWSAPLDELSLAHFAKDGVHARRLSDELRRRFSDSAALLVDAAGDERVYTHRMLSVVSVAAESGGVVDALTKIGASSVGTWIARDLPEFFDACGSSYVRSINRRVSRVSVVTYETDGPDRDLAVEASLKAAFGEVDQSAAGSCSAACEARLRRATIETHHVVGGAPIPVQTDGYTDEKLTKASRDFVRTYEGAPLSHDGWLVTQMEVAPWSEQVEFVAAHPLTPAVVPVLDASGKPVMDERDPSRPQTRTVEALEQKRTLQLNAEFLAEIRRATRAKLEAFEQAKRCKAMLAETLLSKPGRGAKLVDVGERRVPNQRNPNESISVRELAGDLAQDKLHLMWTEYDTFVNGGRSAPLEDVEADPDESRKLTESILQGDRRDVGHPSNLFPGTRTCLTELKSAGMSLRPYRSLSSCARLEAAFQIISARKVLDYCAPTP